MNSLPCQVRRAQLLNEGTVMCNYKYTSDYKYLPRLMGKECPYTKIYSQLKNNGTYNFENSTSNLELPLDSHGICIFHSDNTFAKRRVME